MPQEIVIAGGVVIAIALAGLWYAYFYLIILKNKYKNQAKLYANLHRLSQDYFIKADQERRAWRTYAKELWADLNSSHFFIVASKLEEMPCYTKCQKCGKFMPQRSLLAKGIIKEHPGGCPKNTKKLKANANT